ncbi:MAG: hypothetical protein QNJ98_07250 [Planctomycetota bacterium]|nr:hypothetical protein [Planctomycetota bacterium]
MTRKQLLLGLLFAGAAVAGLMFATSDWTPPETSGKRVAPPSAKAPTVEVPTESRIPLPGETNSAINKVKGVFVQAPPEFVVWRDPDNPADPVEIPSYYAWTLRAESVEPLTRNDGDRIGALCRNVVFDTFRSPRTHVEALSLARQDRGAQNAVLHRRIEAAEARVFGRMVPQLLQDQSERAKVRLSSDSEIRFSKNLKVFDADERLTITGEEITAYPKLGTASGKKDFVLKHAAFVITGRGIELNKIDEGRALAEILQKASLQLLEDPSKSDGGSVLGFDGNKFRRATVTAEGRAIIRRDELPTGERLRIEMFDYVHLSQEGGRSLDAKRLTVEAIQDVDPQAPTRARSGGWRLRKLEADGDVQLRETRERAGGKKTLLTARTDHLTHDVPTSGAPTTLFEGKTSLTFEGDVPLDGRQKQDGLVRASSRDRLWIGPVVDRTPPEGIEAESLRRVLLIGDARLERHGRGTATADEDILEGDEIELVFFADPLTKERRPADDGLASGMDRVTALEFTAKGHVRLGGTRVNGSTDLLVATDLASSNVKISAVGKGTRLSFPEIRTNQRLVGRDKPATPRAPPGAVPADRASDDPEGSWHVRRLTASGNVDVATTLGGPALGLSTHMTGLRLTYEELSNLARLEGGAGSPARIEADSLGDKPNRIEAQTLSLDRGRGLVAAKGGVRGELWTERKGLNAESVRGAFRRGNPAPPSVLEIVTDDRIDIGIVRTGPRGGVQLDTEQTVKIHGPLTAELRSDRMLIDRLRADMLEIALVLASREAPDAAPSPTLPGLRKAPEGRTERKPRALRADQLMRMKVDAGEITADVSGGTAKRIEAFGGVKLSSEMGEVTGKRIIYDGAARTVDVLGQGARGAEAWFATEQGMRNMVAAERFLLTLGENGTDRIQAEPAAGQRVIARLFHTSAPDAQGRTQLEGYAIWSRGPIDMRPNAVTATGVVVERRVSRNSGGTWSAPAQLWSPTLRVEGRDLLRSGNQGLTNGQRNVQKVIAEGESTTIQTGTGRNLLRVRGQRVVLDVEAEQAVITGAPGKPVRSTKGEGESEVDGVWTEATIDLKTGLPTFRGPKIILRGK